jgi:hypothetical protein
MCPHVLYLYACRCPLTHLLLLPFIECATVCLALNPVCVAWVVTASVNRAHSWPHSHEGTKHEFMNQPGRRSTYTSRQGNILRECESNRSSSSTALPGRSCMTGMMPVRRRSFSSLGNAPSASALPMAAASSPLISLPLR